VIPAGQYVATFNVQTFKVSANVVVTVSATAAGKTATATLTVNH
jgi:hypothetical protein